MVCRAAAVTFSGVVSYHGCCVSVCHRCRGTLFRPRALRTQEYHGRLVLCQDNADTQLSGAGSLFAGGKSGGGRKSVLFDCAAGLCSPRCSDGHMRGHNREPSLALGFVYDFLRGCEPQLLATAQNKISYRRAWSALYPVGKLDNACWLSAHGGYLQVVGPHGGCLRTIDNHSNAHDYGAADDMVAPPRCQPHIMLCLRRFLSYV